MGLWEAIKERVKRSMYEREMHKRIGKGKRSPFYAKPFSEIKAEFKQDVKLA